MALGDFFNKLVSPFLSTGPNIAAAPEDDTAPPLTDQIVIAHDPATMIVPDKYLSTIKANDDTVLKREGSQDLRIFEALLDDDVAMSTFQQRRLAVISCETEVAPGDENDPRSVEAADHLRDQLKAISWDRITDRMLYTVWFGFGVGEPLYTVGADGKVCLKDIVVPDRKWFAFTNEGELRFAANVLSMGGQKLPPNKFWVIRSGGTHDFAFYGLGLAHWVYWPVWFKRAAMRFWALYLEKMGRPTTLAAYDPNGSQADKDTIMAAAEAAGSQSAITVPDALFEKFKIIESSRSGAGTSSFGDFVSEQNDSTTRIVLGSPGMSRPTAGGIGSGQSEKEEGVKQEIVKADADLICESFNGTVARWLTMWNFGPGVKPPRVYRVIEEAESIDAIAERDSKLDAIGIKRTEQSVAEVYGPGYELDRPAPVAVDPATGLPIAPPIAAANDDEKAAAKKRAEFSAMEPAPLYVSRKLLNGKDVAAWAKENGFTDVLDPADMHVTLLYSRRAVDWLDMGETWGHSQDGRYTVQPGGPRVVQMLGKQADAKVAALLFHSDEFKWRHDRMIAQGASHDFAEYSPHVTFARSAEGVDLEAIDAFNGELRFGPEIFERIDDERAFAAGELEFSAEDMDAIEALSVKLAAEGSPVFAAIAETIRADLKGVTSLEGARVALLQTFERLPYEKLAELTSLPFLATRAGALAGAEDAVKV